MKYGVNMVQRHFCRPWSHRFQWDGITNVLQGHCPWKDDIHEQSRFILQQMVWIQVRAQVSGRTISSGELLQ